MSTTRCILTEGDWFDCSCSYCSGPVWLQTGSLTLRTLPSASVSPTPCPQTSCSVLLDPCSLAHCYYRCCPDTLVFLSTSGTTAGPFNKPSIRHLFCSTFTTCSQTALYCSLFTIDTTAKLMTLKCVYLLMAWFLCDAAAVVGSLDAVLLRHKLVGGTMVSWLFEFFLRICCVHMNGKQIDVLICSRAFFMLGLQGVLLKKNKKK